MSIQQFIQQYNQKLFESFSNKYAEKYFMDKFFEMVYEHYPTDVSLMFKDAKTTIRIPVHKAILSCCPYFIKLFGSQQMDQIIINVPDAYICYDVVMLFYYRMSNIGNLPPNEHLFKLSLYRDFFFCSDPDVNNLSALKIPTENCYYFMTNILFGGNQDIK